MADLGTTQLTLLWASVVIGIVYLLAAVLAGISQRGMGWALGPRDGTPPEVNAIAGRLDRAWKNYLETFPLFAVAVLLEAHAGHGSGLAPLGAQLYFWGRVAYLPLYVTGLPLARSAAWTAAMAGIVLVLLACLPGF